MVLCYIIYIAYSFQCIFHQRANSHRIHINHISIGLSAPGCGLLAVFHQYFWVL